MEHLPPIGWADVATQTDLDHLRTVIESRFDTRFAELRTEMADMRTETAKQFKDAQRWQLTALACVTTIITAILGVLITLT